MTQKRTDEWDPRDAAILGDPLAAYDAMRRNHRLAWSDYQQWSVFHHADAMRLLTEPEVFSNVVSNRVSVPNGMDPPEHRRYRALIEPYFSPERVAQFRPVCQRIADQLVDRIAPGTPFDAVTEVAEEYALRVQCAFMGWHDRYGEHCVSGYTNSRRQPWPATVRLSN